MKTTSGVLVVLACAVCFFSDPVFAQDGDPNTRQCGLQPALQTVSVLSDTGGFYCASTGTLRVLIVFASFPDDESPNPNWPPHGPPLSMQQFIDPDTTTHSQGSFNLTNYFYQMSMGKFHLIGEAIWVETGHSQEEYRTGAYWRANSNVLQERVDSLVDFSSYDQWTMEAPFNHVNIPDGRVDMVIMVWRTAMWEFLGEASLGYRAGFQVDGKRIEMGFPTRFDFPLGSGVTCKYPNNDTPYQAMQTMVHELGHWLLGGLHPYNGMTLSGKHAYWGLLCSGQRVASCANSYERERLGWLNVPEIQHDVNIPLPDYVSSGVSFKYHPINGDPGEYFYFENHQDISVFDDITVNAEDKGLWILHQQGAYLELDNLKIIPSDGYWDWESPGVTTSCFAQAMPVFKRGSPNSLTGESHRDQIPIQANLTNWMFVYKDPAGQINCGAFFRGEQFVGAFGSENMPVFSEYSNPKASTWGNQPAAFSIEVISSLNGIVTLRYNSNPLDSPPARRYLGADPRTLDTIPGVLHLAWGSQWPEGQLLEADVVWSEVQREVGGGDWESVYGGTETNWSDGGVLYDSIGTVPVRFRVRVCDTQGKYSAWSNVFYTRAILSGVEGEPLVHPGSRYGLEANFPNPFNPTTRIKYQIPNANFVTLKVFDMLGREIATLVNEEMKPGSHVVTLDASGLTSGVYFYRLQAGDFSCTKRMVLMR